ncbi:complement C4-like [Apteryx mantelli]|uniref:Complement C4-like n=1 Tax=Apteryx mantelli TaxID=2696672 RepID=A0ABM4G7T7_9AVES
MPMPMSLGQDAALARAAGFLRGRVETAGPFAAAIGAYALALSDAPGPPGPLLQLARSAHNGSAQFWPAGGAAETVEATGYGLLALLRLNDVAGALRAARWLREQSNYGGGFHSTQDTVVALEALSELWLNSLHPEELGLDVTFAWPLGLGGHGAAGGTRVTLQKGLEHVEKKLEVPLGSPVTVQVEGEGQGTLTVLRRYRVMSPANGTCRELGLEVTLSGPIDYEEEEDYEDYEEAELAEEVEPAEGVELEKEAGLDEGAEPSEGTAPLSLAPWVEARRRRRALESPELRSRQVAFHVCIWRQPGTLLSGMAVVDISLLSGFRPHREDLDKLQDVVDRYISHYELDRSRLVLYFDEVPPQRDCVTFGATQEVAVGLLQPAAATIFDYYEPEHRCTVFYSAPQRSSFLATLCSPGVCECAEGACPRARRTLAEELTAAERHDFACYSPRVDYALVVTVRGEKQFGAFAGAETEIEEILQSGPWEAAVGQRRWFFVRAGCGLRLRSQRRYLLMGRGGPTRDPQGRPQAMLGPNSWVEEVPSPSRCGATRLRGLCAELQSFLRDFAQHGCQV